MLSCTCLQQTFVMHRQLVFMAIGVLSTCCHTLPAHACNMAKLREWTCIAFLAVTNHAYAGYPFDIPGRCSSISTYGCLVYHLPLSIAFAVRQCTSFVWGGCMLLPLADLRSDCHGIMAAWNQVRCACPVT